MTSVTCPYCGKTVGVPEAVVDVGGGWMDCSKCGEQLFLLPDAEGAGELTRTGRWEGDWIVVTLGNDRT